MTEDSTSKTQSLQDLYLSDFQNNNPQCKFSLDEDKFVIEKAWAVDDVRFAFDPSELNVLRDINNTAFLSKFDALFHIDLNEAEFFFAYLRPDEEPDASYLDRNFAFNFMGQTLECCFKEPSQRLFSLFLANALPAITTGAVIGISVGKAAIMAGAMAVIKVVSVLAEASVDGELTSDEIKEAFSGKKK